MAAPETDPKKVLVVLSLLALICFNDVCHCFKCFTCNNKVGEDDTTSCRERLEECAEGISACSTVVFRDFDRKLHVRKFCTPGGTPLYQYLIAFPGSAVCQNIQSQNLANGSASKSKARHQREVSPLPPTDTTSVDPALPSNETKASDAFASASPVHETFGAPSLLPPLPPAPSNVFMSTLLCVCTKSKCNAGAWEDVLHRTMMKNMSSDSPKSKKRFLNRDGIGNKLSIAADAQNL